MRRCFLLGLLLAFAVSRLAPQTPPASHFDGKSWWAHVKFLADDALAGRNTGSEGLRKAEAYAVEQLEKAGLEPAGVNGFFQPVHFTQFQVDEVHGLVETIDAGGFQAGFFELFGDFREGVAGIGKQFLRRGRVKSYAELLPGSFIELGTRKVHGRLI